MFEDESHEDEVRGYGDGENGKGRQFAAEADPEEEVEEHDMQQIVHEVGPAEAQSVLRRSLLLKREVGREVVVHQEAQHVADGIGHVHLYPVLQYPVDGIVDGSRCGASFFCMSRRILVAKILIFCQRFIIIPNY